LDAKVAEIVVNVRAVRVVNAVNVVRDFAKTGLVKVASAKTDRAATMTVALRASLDRATHKTVKIAVNASQSV